MSRNEPVRFSILMLIVSPGSPEEKSSLMFSMNDIGGTGSLSPGEFARMLRFAPHFLSVFASGSSQRLICPFPDASQVLH